LPKPVIYLSALYRKGDQLAIVLYDLPSGECSFVTLVGKDVVRFGELGKINPINIGDTSILFVKEAA